MTQVAMYLKGVFIAVSLFIAFSTTRLLHWFTCCGARGWERARRTESSRRGRWHLSGQTRSGDGVRERECGTYLLLVVLLVLQNDLDALLDDVAHFVPDERDLCTRKKKSSEGTPVSEGYVAVVRAPSNNHCRFASLCRPTLSRASLSSKTTCDRKVKGFRTLGLPPRCLCLPCLFWAKEPGFVPRGSRHAREGPKGPAFCQGSTRARSMRSASRSLGLCLPESILSSKPEFVFRALHFRGNVVIRSNIGADRPSV